MRKFRLSLLLVLFTALCASALPLTVSARQARPAPYPVIPTPAFADALEAGVRTASGAPGDAYWTNGARYTIDAVLSPATKMLRGRARAVYVNHSPDALDRVMVHLRQNLHQAGAVRNRPQQITGGVQLSEVSVDGAPLVEHGRGRDPGYVINGTVMTIHLPTPIPAGGSATFDFAWAFEVPEAGAPRMGHEDDVFYLGYWYPQFAVYDDVHGWVADQYMGNGEFYMDFADYDVHITTPEGWLVAATGELQNPDAVLSDQTRARLQAAHDNAGTDLGAAIVHLVTEEDREAGVSTAESASGALTWHFSARNVRDFAFGASQSYVWDATVANVGDRDGDGRAETSMIHALYRPDAGAWERAAEFTRFTIEYLSEYLMPYPYPQMTAVEGIIGGGMEYPMITLIGGTRTDASLFGVTFHETAHMWFPMIVGQNETRFTWMDEGMATFTTNEGRGVFFPDETPWDPARQSYYRIAGTGNEVESMRHGDEYPYGTPARGIASYSKPAVTMHALRGLVGQADFQRALREYVRRWAFKHPYPYDLFNTFEDVLGRDFDWFWTPMLFQTWTLDQAVTGVEQRDDGVRVTIADQGLTPMPAPVRVTYADGRQVTKTVPVEVWLGGDRTEVLTFEPGEVSRVEIDPERFFPDVDRQNNVWQP